METARSFTKVRLLTSVMLMLLSAVLINMKMSAEDEFVTLHKYGYSTSCVYQSPWCSNLPIFAAWGWRYDASWSCEYERIGGNTGWLHRGPFNYQCSVYSDGCCTMPKTGDCPPSDCPQQVQLP